MSYSLKIILFLIISSITFGKLSDGIYSVRNDETTWFWYPYTEIVVNKGKIVKVIHDKVNSKGVRASKYNFHSEKLEKKIKNLIVQLEKNYYKANGNIDKMDAIAGATESVDEFKRQYKFLIKQKLPGNYIMKK